jgi:cytoskeletal protein CcmA (bactofilin family)
MIHLDSLSIRAARSARLCLALLAAIIGAAPVWAQGPAGGQQATAGKGKRVQISVGISSANPRGVSRVSAKGNYYAAGESVSVTTAVDGDAVAAGGTVDLSADVKENAVLAGGNLTVHQRVGQNAIVAGGNVLLQERVGQDAIVAGGNVTIQGPVGDDLRAAGGSVSVAGNVAGDLLAAGGNVTLEPAASVGGEAWLAGGTVNVRGSVAHDLRVRGGEIRLGGSVHGNVELRGRRIVVEPTARVDGRLVYASREEARIDPGARIAGGVERQALPAWEGQRLPWLSVVLCGLAALLALLVTVTVLRWAFPAFSLQAAGTLALHPWKSLALGFALFVCIPAAAVVLFVFVIGTPLGIGLLLLYPLAIALGLFVTAVWIAEALGRAFFGRRGAAPGWQLALLWLAALVMAGVGLIPWLGQLALFVALLFGLGALGLHLAARYAGGGVAAGGR